ncbi:glycerophosphoryl diester phosphodiesterase membrane domain-containing protein [Cellulomonas sp. Marseille-Q8402]
MSTPHDEGRPEDAPRPGEEQRPEPRYGQYAPAGWQAPGSAQPAQPANPWGDAGTHPGGARPGDAPPAYGQQQPGHPQQPGYPPQPGYPQGPGYPPPGYGQQYGQQPGAPAGWGPAPYQPPVAQPGIIPLRPISIWEIFDGAFRAIRHNPKTMFGLTAVVVAITTAIGALVQWYLAGLLADELNTFFTGTAGLTTAETELFGDSFGTSLASFASVPLTALATTILTGLLILSVSRSVIGQRVTVGEVVRGSGKRILWVIAFSLLLGLAVLVVGAALVGLVVLVASTSDSIGLTILTLLVVAAVMLVGAFWIAVRTLLAPAALMLEGGGFWASIARAWRLTRGSYWRLLGLYLLVNILVSIVAQIVIFPVTMIASLALDDPFLTSGPAIALTALGTAVATTITTVFMAGVVALAYIDVRMRREGLDVELARAADAQR